MAKFKKRLPQYTVLLILTIVGLIIIIPYVWMILTSFRSTSEVLKNPGTMIPIEWTTKGYAKVLTQSPFFRWFANSLFIAVIVTTAVIFTSTITGFVFSKYRFKFKDTLFWIVLATMMVPYPTTMIPNFLIIDNLGLYDKIAALIIPALVSGFGIYLCRQFCDEIPDSLCEAALIDGAGPVRIYSSIIMPQLKPCIAALGIFTFLESWNEYLKPLIMLSQVENMTLPLALSFFSTQHNNDVSATMAASALIMIPVTVLLLVFQKQFIKGVAITGMK